MSTNATFRHEVQFYSSDSALLESFARFIRNALKSHIAVVASRVSAKPAMRGHFKTGHSRPGTLDVVPVVSLSCKSHF